MARRYSLRLHFRRRDTLPVVSKLKCPLFRAHDMSCLRLKDRRRGCGKVGIPRCVLDSQAERKSLPLGFSSQRLFHSLSPAIQFALAQTRPSLRVITADDMRPIANTPALVQMLADRDRASGQSSPPARRFDLQNLSSHYDGVIPVHHSLLLHREHHLEILSPAGHKGAPPLCSGDLKTPIELGRVFLPEKNVGFL